MTPETGCSPQSADNSKQTATQERRIEQKYNSNTGTPEHCNTANSQKQEHRNTASTATKQKKHEAYNIHRLRQKNKNITTINSYPHGQFDGHNVTPAQTQRTRETTINRVFLTEDLTTKTT